MSALKTLTAAYGGEIFRSRSEARWAVFFDELGLAWQYEPEGYELESRNYLPDFWLPGLSPSGSFFEVKGDAPSDLELQLCRELAKHTRKPVFLHFGLVGPHYGPTQKTLGFIPAIPTTDPSVDEGDRFFFAECPVCSRIGVTVNGRGDTICSGAHTPPPPSLSTADSPRFTSAYTKARVHRFWNPRR